MTHKSYHIDLNCDLGEGTHEHPLPEQDALFPYLSSCNIACGFHGGDPIFIEQAVKLAIIHQVRIGAHPSYPGREHFGRKPISMPPNYLAAAIRYQLSALKGVVESLGGSLSYVKPHGALYNQMAHDKAIATPVLQAIKATVPELKLMGLAGSPLADWASAAGLVFLAEAFADRRYARTGKLVPRTHPDALLHTPEEVVAQAQRITTQREAVSIEGEVISIEADSLCLHGDHPNALANAQALHKRFKALNIQIRS
jgi:UPF0271 protein